MKILIKYISVLFISLCLFNCDEENNFQEPNIALTTVYSITDIQGTDAPFKINIYRERDLIIEYSSSVNVTSFVSTNYLDVSSDTNYEISVNKEEENTSILYLIFADKTTGVGTLTVDGVTVYNILISEAEVYN